MKRSRLFLLFLIAAPLLALAGTVFLLVAYATAFDPSVSRYFASGNALPTVAAILLLLAVACGIVGAILAKREPDSLTAAPVPSRAALFAAFGALASAVWLLIAGKVLIGVLTLLSSVFFTLCACTVAKMYGKVLLWSGFSAIAATIAHNATIYFDMSVEMNAPTKILMQMALLAAMLYITAECRLLTKRFDRLLIPILTVLCTALCFSAGSVGLYLFFTKKETQALYVAAAPFLIGVGLFACFRLLQMLIPAKKIEDQPVAESPKAPEREESDV
ncbi:MAG: hypothetical protein E7680_05775 [Ruminococcaceae bacterium]|nr:hypothetical protein [Oscillospiraceae bacterium]